MMGVATLARGGREVLVLSESIGFGASGRGGGRVGSGNQRFTVKRLTELYGRDQARIIQEGTAALAYVKTFIEREGIECHLRINGRFRGASKPEHYENMARDMEDLYAIGGVESFMVARGDQQAEIGSNLYHGGSVIPGDASLHPALYHQGLTARAEESGVQMRSHTPARAIEQTGSGARVITDAGAVQCEAGTGRHQRLHLIHDARPAQKHCASGRSHGRNRRTVTQPADALVAQHARLRRYAAGSSLLPT